MQTVTFQCGHCGKLMGVSAQYLGQQVQCPHCQGVVVAPTAMPTEPVPEPEPEFQPEPLAPPPPAPSFSLDQIQEHESIFSAPSPDDDIFGEDETPRLEMELPSPAAPAMAAPPLEETVPFLVPQQLEPGEPTGVTDDVPMTQPLPSREAASEWVPTVDMEGMAGTEGLGGGLSPTSQRASRVGSEDSPLRTVIMISLVSYSVLATIGLLFTLFTVSRERENDSRTPRYLETLPDVHGDRPGVQKKKGADDIQGLHKANEEEVPAHLRVKLNETLTVGEVEVTPLAVELKPISVFVAGYDRPEPTEHDALVLSLRLKNISSQYTFAPLDSYFDRQFKGGSPPLTYLALAGSSQRFYGGAGHWRPLGEPLRQRDEPRSWVEGRPMVFPYLGPGESISTFVCTDATTQLQEAVARHRGDYLWRVHLRRGPVQVEGRSAPVPVTAVIGVEFSAGDIVRP